MCCSTLQAGRTRTKDKYRIVYSDHQRLELEKEFHYSRYITIRRKAELANSVGLSERQVNILNQSLYLDCKILVFIILIRNIYMGLYKELYQNWESKHIWNFVCLNVETEFRFSRHVPAFKDKRMKNRLPVLSVWCQ